MTTVGEIPEVIEDEVQNRTVSIAAAAAQQVDDANKDAEAIARAAIASEHGARLQAMQEENATWRGQMETRLAETQAATAAAVEASRLSILEALSKAQTPPATVVTEPVIPVASEHEEPEHNSKPQDTTAAEKKPPQEPQRQRRAI